VRVAHQSSRDLLLNEIFLASLEDLRDQLSFISKVAKMPRANRRPGQGRMVDVIKTEEKSSDVALGSLLVAHGYQGRYEAPIVLSNDSDLVLPIRIVREELGLPIGILNPPTVLCRALARSLVP
jgi:hypothetical protein